MRFTLKSTGVSLTAMPISDGKTQGADDETDSRLPTAWQCRKCGDVHEGTQEQARKRECLHGKV